MKTKTFLQITARTISQISQPPLAVGLFTLFLMLRNAPDLTIGLIWFIIAVTPIGIIPVIFALIAYKMGWIKDLWLNRRQDRIGPFLIASMGIIITLILFYKIGVPQIIIVFFMAILLAVLVSLIITMFWKISMHATTITAVVVAMNVITHGQYWYLFFLIPIVMWARVYRKRHTWAQVIAGALINGLIVYGTFQIFGY